MNAQLIYPAINKLNQTNRYKLISPLVLAVCGVAVAWGVIASLYWMPLLEHFTDFTPFRSAIGMTAVAVTEVLKYYLSEQVAAVLMEVISDYLVIL
jgi:hypothetical protein